MQDAEFNLTPMRIVWNRLNYGLAVVVCVSLGIAPSAIAQSVSINGITPGVFDCMKANTRERAGHIIYRGGNSGRIQVFGAGIGQVGEVTYSFNASQGVLSITHVRGPAPLAQIHNGLNSTANRCKSGELS
jgi:predicted RecA/RadA family phage recombinase